MTEKTVIDKIVGVHIWHGDHAFDGIVTPISNDTAAIIKITDSTLQLSAYRSLTIKPTHLQDMQCSFLNGGHPLYTTITVAMSYNTIATTGASTVRL